MSGMMRLSKRIPQKLGQKWYFFWESKGKIIELTVKEILDSGNGGHLSRCSVKGIKGLSLELDTIYGPPSVNQNDSKGNKVTYMDMMHRCHLKKEDCKSEAFSDLYDSKLEEKIEKASLKQKKAIAKILKVKTII